MLYTVSSVSKETISFVQPTITMADAFLFGKVTVTMSELRFLEQQARSAKRLGGFVLAERIELPQSGSYVGGCVTLPDESTVITLDTQLVSMPGLNLVRFTNKHGFLFCWNKEPHEYELRLASAVVQLTQTSGF